MELQCSGLPFTVRPELANALIRMHLQNSTRIIWADAICINQDDVEERNHQVPLMGSIYSSARRVIACLGLADPTLDYIQETFEVLELISRAFQQVLDDQGDEPQDRWKSVQISAHGFTPTAHSGLSKIFDRPWFTRIWCLQEIRLAADALVLCGEHEINWHHLGTAPSWFFDQNLNLGVGNSNGDYVAELILSINSNRVEHMYNNLPWDLLRILRNSRKFDLTDPRDKVYAILNLVAPRSELVGFEVCYDRSVRQVFANTAVFITNKTSRLDCLAHVWHPPDYDGDLEYRSWAPRWDHRDHTFTIGEWGLRKYLWSVCPSLIATITDENDLEAEELVLRGIYYDRVQQMTEILDLHTTNAESTRGKIVEDNEGSLHDHRQSWLRGSDTAVAASSVQPGTTHPLLALYQMMCSRLFPSSSSSDLHLQVQARNRLLARTVVSDMLGVEFVENLEDSVQEEFYISFRHLLRELSSVHQSFSHSGRPYTADAISVLYKVSLQCYRRRVFWTNNGSLAQGPACMRVGDIVVALYGGTTPFVLRPRGDKYIFMGEGYVDNIMHGELMQALYKGQVHEQTFRLI